MIMDLGGSQAAGMLGILGPVGLLMGMTADAAHKLDFKARTERRSEEFSKLVGENFPDQSINQMFARQIGDLIAKDGRGVKVTKVTRPSGSDDLAASVSKDLTPFFVPATPAEILKEGWKMTTKNDGSIICVRGLCE
ncbi:hypothetical protein [Achromobacter anxifer]